jgi:PAS domain S-box-containing protein/putative nucleotidyltransferase with HDIG domain
MCVCACSGNTVSVSRCGRRNDSARATAVVEAQAVTGVDVQLWADSSAPILFVKGLDATMQYVDALGAAFIGLAPEDICGRSWFDLLHPDDVDTARAAWKQALSDNAPYRAELRLRNAAGVYRWMSDHASPLLAPDGTIEKWIDSLRDIDDHNEAADRRRALASDAAKSVAHLEALLSTAPLGILFVDRDFRYVRVNEEVAAIHGSATVGEHVGHTVAEIVPALWAQLESSYRSVLETGDPVVDVPLSGATAADPGHVHHWLESIHAVQIDGETIGLGIVLDDITERIEHMKALVALTEAAVGTMAAAAEARDPYSAGHQQRVAELAVAIAIDLGLNQRDVDGLRLAGKVHDIGKLAIPSLILNKPSHLRPTEFALIKEHAQAGSDIVRGIDFPWPVADVILQHHERLDGSGYPAGLVGDEILLGARIIAVADVVEAMSSHRPYRASLGITAALSEIESGRGTLYDAEVVDVCLRRFREDGWRFSTGEQSGAAAADHDIPIDAGVLDDLL